MRDEYHVIVVNDAVVTDSNDQTHAQRAVIDDDWGISWEFERERHASIPERNWPAAMHGNFQKGPLRFLGPFYSKLGVELA